MRDLLESLRDAALRKGVSFMDARAMETEGTSIQRQDGRADKASRYRRRGVGIRVLVNGAWGFAAAGGLDREPAFESLEAAIALARGAAPYCGEEVVLAEAPVIQDRVQPVCARDPRGIPLRNKMDDLARFEQAALNAGSGKLANIVVNYWDAAGQTVLCNTRGTLIESGAVRVSLHVSLTAHEGGLRQRAQEHRAAIGGYELMDTTTPDEVAGEAARRAVSLLNAPAAPAGRFTVIFHPSITGLLTHEALGHNAEADHVLSGESILDGKVGESVAAPCITILDDATVPGSWGSYRYDSEGVPGQRKTLIENGVLKGFMNSLETAGRLGVTPNGNARAQGFDCRPLVRMSNTFIEPGHCTFEDMLRGVEDGLYLRAGQWGYVFCERGQYTCSAGEGYRIRHGELAEHLRDVCVSGMTLETLQKADAVSQDFEMRMCGMCGKSGQSAPVNGGGPHVRVHDVVAGGQA